MVTFFKPLSVLGKIVYKLWIGWQNDVIGQVMIDDQVCLLVDALQFLTWPVVRGLRFAQHHPLHAAMVALRSPGWGYESGWRITVSSDY